MVFLAHPSISAILAYMPFEKRRDLAKISPSVRWSHRRLSFRLDSVNIEIDTNFISLKLDGVEFFFAAVGEKMKKSKLEEFRKMTFDDTLFPQTHRNELLKKMLNFFLGRPGTLVEHMKLSEWEDNKWCESEDFQKCQLKINNFNLHCAKNRENAINFLRNSEIFNFKFAIMDGRILEDIKKNFRIKNEVTANESMYTYHNATMANLKDIGVKFILHTLFIFFWVHLKQLKTTENVQLGSRIVAGAVAGLDISGILKELEDFGDVKRKGRNCLIFSTINPQKELNVTWKTIHDKKSRPFYQFEAEIQGVDTVQIED